MNGPENPQTREPARRAMHIVLFSPGDHEHKSPKVVYFADWLTRQGHAVTLLCVGAPVWLRDSALRVRLLKGESWAKPFRYLSYFLQLRRLLARRPADLLMAVNDPGAVVGAWASLWTGLPLVVLAQERTAAPGGSLKLAVLAWHYRRAGVVLDTSPQAAQWRRCVMKLRRRTGSFLNVPPPASAGGGAQAAAGSVLRLVYAGYVSEWQCLKELVRAVARVDADVGLDIYGPGDRRYLRELSGEIEALSLGGSVRQHDSVPRDRLAGILAEAHAGVVLYDTDGTDDAASRYCSPNKLFEYVSLGLPVLASRQETLLSWVEGRGVGVCVDPADATAIAAGIVKLTDPELRRRMSASALRAHSVGGFKFV